MRWLAIFAVVGMILGGCSSWGQSCGKNSAPPFPGATFCSCLYGEAVNAGPCPDKVK